MRWRCRNIAAPSAPTRSAGSQNASPASSARRSTSSARRSSSSSGSILNAFAFAGRWDPYPFILLNLAFSTQAAYAAPLILLAQTRQADRDKNLEERAEQHHEEQVRLAEQRVAAIKAETDKLSNLLESNTNLTRQDKELTEQVAELTREIRGLLTRN